ncbi:hypothetical protein HD554DRAFT_2106653 [Boletus coccyginus]|nr:hypothetical protein HD554DRAFT_2106653 [Boletus coccyginus]
MSRNFKRWRSVRQCPLSVGFMLSWILWHVKWTQSAFFIRESTFSTMPSEDSRRVVCAKGGSLMTSPMCVNSVATPER